MPVVSDWIAAMGTNGTSIACVCDDSTAGLRSALPSVQAALGDNERCVYILDETPSETVLQLLLDAGLDTDAALASGKLGLCRYDELDGGAPEFDLETRMDAIVAMAKDTRQRGYRGLRTAVEMTWTLRSPVSAQQMAQLRARLMSPMPDLGWGAVCLYPRDRFPDYMLLDALRVHPVVMLDGEQFINPHYVPTHGHIDHEAHRAALERAISSIRSAAAEPSAHPSIVGESREIHRILRMIEQVAPTEASVLITGETGTGKELVAAAIHAQSARRNGPYVRVNCAAVPADLLEVELFGHERGAFTDAHEQRVGRLELANGGTLMLDEISEMSPGMQAKLLRVLEEREFERVGGRETMPLDIRLVALTNRDLLEAGRVPPFRRDLYYRLNVIEIHIAPLRERMEDVPVLASAFLERACERVRRRVEGIDRDAMEVLLQHDWPGNVRELENVIERAVVLTRNRSVSREDLGFLCANGGSSAPMSLTEMEARHIGAILRLTGGNRTKAAEILGIHRDTLYRKLRQYDIGMP